jgi:hypothetical protein
LKRINILIENGLHLHSLKTRYSEGIVIFLARDEEHAERIASDVTAGDSTHESLCNYFDNNNWYPIAYGLNFGIAVHNLILRINSISEEIFNKGIYEKAIGIAGQLYVNSQEPAPLANTIEEYYSVLEEYYPYIRN